MNVLVTPTAAAAATEIQRHPAIIIGTGFGGIAMAIALKKDGINNFIMLERAGDIGGTWRDNSYPGAACDVVSRLYSYSFEQDYPWSSPFAPQAEIWDYQIKIVAKYGIRPHIRFNTEVVSAVFNDGRGEWTVTTADGTVFVTPILISAVGLFKEANIPNIPGRDDFKGVTFHSSRWNHKFDLTGKTVAVIGNGASAVQFVPAIADKVAKLNLFIRTPQYVMPRSAFPGTSPLDQWLGKRKSTRWLARLRTYLLFERFLFRRIWFPYMRLRAEAAYRGILDSKVKDPVLRKKLTPDYPIGCKRLLLSDIWIDTLVRPNIEVIDTGIERITADGVQTRDGKSYKVDAIIYGTGFRPTDHLAPMRVTGLAGKDLNQAWLKGAEAYLGITVSGFPNFFIMYGPNTNAATSIIFILESQAHYIVRAIRKLENNRARWMNVREDVQNAFNTEIQEKLATTVPAMAGCHTYFKNEYGKLTTNWPNYSTEYRLRTRNVRTGDFEFAPRELAAG